MHEQAIIDTILNSHDTEKCSVKVISLICSEETLIKRLQKDIDEGKRNAGIIERSLPRIPMYRQINSISGNVPDRHRTGHTICGVSGRLRFDTTELAKYPAVGDFVMISSDAQENNAIIHSVLTGKSVFLRTAVGVNGQAQSVVANIDKVFICMPLNENFSLSRLERYLSVAWDSGATPVVILTKADLCEDQAQKVAQAERMFRDADGMKNVHRVAKEISRR